MYGVGSGLWANLAPRSDRLLETERPAPARPTPLEFPNHIPSRRAHSLSRRHMAALRQSLLSIRRPPDVQPQHLSHLNIHLDHNVPLTDFVPSDEFRQRPFLYDSDLSSMLNELALDNQDAYREIMRLPPLEGRPKPKIAYSRNFYSSLEDMSRYWDTSEDQYYFVDETGADSVEKDNNVGITGSSDDKPLPQNINMTDTAQLGNHVLSSVEVLDNQVKPFSQGLSPSSIATTSTQTSGPERPQSSISWSQVMEREEKYRGHRVGSGAQMPAGTRVAAVRNLLKMVVYKFNCRDYDLSPKDRLRIRDINIWPAAIMFNFCIARIPSEAKLARARMVEGPVLGVCCRSEVKWKAPEQLTEKKPINGASPPTIDRGDFVGERFDLLREMGGLLYMALLRGREGRTKAEQEHKDAERSWWVQKERWGGGPIRWGMLVSEVFEDEDPSWSPEERKLQMQKRADEEEQNRKLGNETIKPNDVDVNDLLAYAGNERPKKKNRRGPELEPKMTQPQQNKIDMRDGRRLVYTPALRKRWYEDWGKLKSNASIWDDKFIYRRLGQQGGEFDDVFQVSSLNHHVCLLRLRIHSKYVAWLESDEAGSTMSQEPASDADEKTKEQAENELHVSRSKWFDLFDIAQRQEFLVGLWRLMSWINRDVVPSAEVEKMMQARATLQKQKESEKAGARQTEDANADKMDTTTAR